jgi:sugar lactone lactonase YvrE
MHYEHRLRSLAAKVRLAIAMAIVLLVAGNALAAEPQYLLGITADAAGNVFLADRELPGVWQLADGKLSLVFQGSKKFRTPLNAVRCLAIDQQGKLLAGDSATRDVFRFGDDKLPVPLTKGEIGIPMGIAVTKSGDLLVADLEIHRIFKVPAAGGQPAVFAEVPAPRALTIDKDDRAWVVSHGKDQLLRGTPEGKLEVVVSGRPFEFPSAIVVNDEGVAFVCDTYAKAIWKVLPGKQPEKLLAGDPLVSPVGMTRLGTDLLVADPRAKAVIRIDAAGKASRETWTVVE